MHQALRQKWCLSGNPDTLKVTDPQGATGTLQVIVVKQTETFFWIPAPLIGFAAKTASHLWWTWPYIGQYLEFFHSKTLLQALPRWWPSELTWFLVLVHVKKLFFYVCGWQCLILFSSKIHSIATKLSRHYLDIHLDICVSFYFEWYLHVILLNLEPILSKMAISTTP